MQNFRACGGPDFSPGLRQPSRTQISLADLVKLREGVPTEGGGPMPFVLIRGIPVKNPPLETNLYFSRGGVLINSSSYSEKNFACGGLL